MGRSLHHALMWSKADRALSYLEKQAYWADAAKANLAQLPGKRALKTQVIRRQAEFKKSGSLRVTTKKQVASRH